MLITSRSNPKIVSLRKLAVRKERERIGAFYVGGYYLVQEALNLGRELTALVVAEDAARGRFRQGLASLVARCWNVPTLSVTPEVFASIEPRDLHHGVGAAVAQRWHDISDLDVGAEDLWVALDRVQYPSNLGTILRVLDAVGGSGCLLLGHTTDPHDPATVRASLGAILSQRLVRAGPAELASWKRRHGLAFIGTSPHARRDYRDVTYPQPAVVILGNEHTGVSDEQQALCDVVVSIPMQGRCESHNVAVAAALVLYEIAAQRARK